MSDENDPLKVKTRLPFEQQSSLASHPGVRAAAVLYGILALILVGVAGYMAFSVGHPMVSVPVIAPALGALYFFIRLAMMLRPKI